MDGGSVGRWDGGTVGRWAVGGGQKGESNIPVVDTSPLQNEFSPSCLSAVGLLFHLDSFIQVSPFTSHLLGWEEKEKKNKKDVEKINSAIIK